jgi:pyrroloquinoline quinone biosynthesis protein D
MTLVGLDVIPKFAAGVRLKHDQVRSRHVVLGPELLVDLNQTGHAILSEVDGLRSISEIIERLARQFEVDADVIATDVQEFCTGMLRRQVLSQ